MASLGPRNTWESLVVLEESPARGCCESRTTFPRSPRGGAPKAARGRDWLASRPHAEELKEQLCCDRGRAARPRELRGKGSRRGGECGPVSRKREEKRKGDQGRDGKGRKGKELAQAEKETRGLWGRLGAASAETLWDPSRRTRGSRGETAPQSVGWREATKPRSGTTPGEDPKRRRPAEVRERQVGKLETRGRAVPHRRPGGEERIQVRPAVGIGARALREEARLEDPVEKV